MESHRPEDYSRLQQEHERALKSSQDTIKKWEQFKYDYEVLQSRLHTLPDRLTHDIMVPFGRFGFMRGHLYHTNEVMVLLGDNWFAKRTARQAIDITERRKKYVCEMLDKEKKVLEDVQSRTDFVREIATAASQVVEGETFEIREEYDPVEEERRREAKKRERERKMGRVTVPPPRPAFPKKRETPSVGEPLVSETRGEEGVLWAALEKKEAKEEVDHAHKATPTITFRHTAGPELKTPNEDLGVQFITPGDIASCAGEGRHTTNQPAAAAAGQLT